MDSWDKELGTEMATRIAKYLDRSPVYLKRAAQTFQKIVEESMSGRARQLEDDGYRCGVEFRTCVRPDGKLILQARGDIGAMMYMGFDIWGESDKSSEQMCDNWTEWKDM